mgnify:CR=1 FL=1
MKKTVEEILGFEVVEVFEGAGSLELIENSAEYNKEMNVSVESLNDEKTYYVTVLNDDTWEFKGYYQAK